MDNYTCSVVLFMSFFLAINVIAVNITIIIYTCTSKKKAC